MSANAWLTTLSVIILAVTTTMLGIGNIIDARDIRLLEARLTALEATRPNTHTEGEGR